MWSQATFPFRRRSASKFPLTASHSHQSQYPKPRPPSTLPHSQEPRPDVRVATKLTKPQIQRGIFRRGIQINTIWKSFFWRWKSLIMTIMMLLCQGSAVLITHGVSPDPHTLAVAPSSERAVCVSSLSFVSERLNQIETTKHGAQQVT